MTLVRPTKVHHRMGRGPTPEVAGEHGREGCSPFRFRRRRRLPGAETGRGRTPHSPVPLGARDQTPCSRSPVQGGGGHATCFLREGEAQRSQPTSRRARGCAVAREATLEPPALHLLIRLAPALVGDFGVAADRCQAAVAECFGGEPGVAHRLLEQGPEGVPQLVGVKRGDAESPGELAADVLRAGDGEAVGAGGFAGRLEADEQGGGVVLAGGEVLLDRGPRLVGHLDDAFAVTLAEHPQAVGFPVAAVEPEDLRDPGPGGQQQQDQRPVALSGSVSWGSASSS